MKRRSAWLLGLSLAALTVAGDAAEARRAARPTPAPKPLAKIEHVVVIYGENRSFDNLYGSYPGADGLANAKPPATRQVDANGKPLERLPAVWNGRPPA